MTFQKLAVSAATVCLLLGAPGVAMAQEEEPVIDTCDEGQIIYKAVDEIVVDGRSCFINEVLVKGDVTATGGSTVTLISNRVGGSIDVSGATRAFLVANQTFNGDIRVEGNGSARVIGNLVNVGEATAAGGSLFVNDNDKARVNRNLVDGNIECVGNRVLESTFNLAGGTEICP
jgi:DUF4097 and DUF4098 domain-containing protein YvlB